MGWENLFLGVLAVLLIFWFRPGIKALFEQSKTKETDWKGVLIPLGLVVVFCLLLIASV